MYKRQPVNSLVAIPLDGRAARNAFEIIPTFGGSDFVSSPTLSPDGTKLAWLSWNHPNMAWTRSTLHVEMCIRDRIDFLWPPSKKNTHSYALLPCSSEHDTTALGFSLIHRLLEASLQENIVIQHHLIHEPHLHICVQVLSHTWRAVFRLSKRYLRRHMGWNVRSLTLLWHG